MDTPGDGGAALNGGQITLQGAEGIRALAHPARALAIEHLLEGPPATATQLGKLAGISGSAMSYHLRELAKQGIVRRVGSSEDGRERLWEATGARLAVVPDAGRRLPTVAVQTVVARYVDRLVEALARVTAADATRRETPDHGEATIKYGALWLTPAEQERLTSALQQAMQDAGIDQRSHEHHPDGAQRFQLWTFLVPEPPSTGTRHTR